MITDGEVKQDRAANDGNPGYLDVKADLLFLEISHDTCCGIQSKGAASSQKDRVDCFDQVNRIQKVGFSGPWSSTSHVYPGRCTLFTENDSAPRGCLKVLCMADLNAFDSGERDLSRSPPPSRSFPYRLPEGTPRAKVVVPCLTPMWGNISRLRSGLVSGGLLLPE